MNSLNCTASQTGTTQSGSLAETNQCVKGHMEAPACQCLQAVSS